MKPNYLWIVEMKNDFGIVNRWYPTVGAGLTKADAQDELRKWRERNTGMPIHHLRIRKYQSVE